MSVPETEPEVEPDEHTFGDMFDAEPEAPSDNDQRTRTLRRARNVTLVGLGVLVVGLGAYSGPTVYQVLHDRGAKVETPNEVAGLQLDSSDGAKSTADYIRDAVASSSGLNKSVGAVYDDPSADNHSVILIAGTDTIWSPKRSLKNAFSAITDDAGGVTNLRDVTPGKLGGLMRCGTTSTPDGDMPVCGWADHGFLSVLIFPGRTVDQAEQLVHQFRDATQHR